MVPRYSRGPRGGEKKEKKKKKRNSQGLLFAQAFSMRGSLEFNFSGLVSLLPVPCALCSDATTSGMVETSP